MRSISPILERVSGVSSCYGPNSSLSGPSLGMTVLSVNEPSTIILTAIFQSNADSCTGTVVDSTWRA